MHYSDLLTQLKSELIMNPKTRTERTVATCMYLGILGLKTTTPPLILGYEAVFFIITYSPYVLSQT